jgi:hypothetical protein
MLKILNNSFKQQFLMYLTYVLWKISALWCSYRSDNLIIGIVRSNYINSLEIMCGCDAKNVENLKQLV